MTLGEKRKKKITWILKNSHDNSHEIVNYSKIPQTCVNTHVKLLKFAWIFQKFTQPGLEDITFGYFWFWEFKNWQKTTTTSESWVDCDSSKKQNCRKQWPFTFEVFYKYRKNNVFVDYFGRAIENRIFFSTNDNAISNVPLQHPKDRKKFQSQNTKNPLLSAS